MPKDGKYYIISKDDIHGGAVGWEFVNYHTVQSRWHGARPRAAWPDGYLQMPRGPWRRPEFAETPRFLLGKKRGRPPRDLECPDCVFLVSPAMRAVLDLGLLRSEREGRMQGRETSRHSVPAGHSVPI
jgi:hypothetical protein